MMRLKPSVSSRSSSAAGFSLIAASAMSLSLVSRSPHTRSLCSRPLPVGEKPAAEGRRVRGVNSSSLGSIQIIRVFSHMLGQAERVVADEILGTLGVARFERLDDVDVIADRAVHAVLLADGLAADHAHMGEQV